MPMTASPIDPLDHGGLVGLAVARWGGGLDKADGHQIAWVALVIAARSFEPERGKWAGYALLGMRNELVRARGRLPMVRGPVRHPERSPAMRSLDAEIGDGGDMTLHDVLGCSGATVEGLAAATEPWAGWAA